MYEQIVVALAAKVPELMIFLVLVWVFMKAQKSLVNEFVNYMRSRDEQLEGVLEENTEALKENTKALALAVHIFETCERCEGQTGG